MSFCRITGRARNLPKPNFFPLIPPISPADARRLCRITAKRMDDHNFVPLLEMGKRPDCLKCPVTGKSPSAAIHQGRHDYKYVTPILKKEALEKSDLKTFEDLQKVLKRLKSGLNDPDRDKMYVYLLSGVLCGLVVPAEVEEAVRLGELESVSLSRSCDKAAFKIRGRPTLFVPLKEISDVKQTANLFDGSGQNPETLSKQKKMLEEKKRKTLANAKIFEELERQADEELSKDTERPAGNRAKFIGTAKTREARQYREKLATFREIYLPEGNMSGYGENWENAIKPELDNLEWSKISKVRSVDLDYPLPKKPKILPICEKMLERPKNVHIPDGYGLELVPYLECLSPLENQNRVDIIEFILKSRDRASEDDYSSRSTLTSMFSGSDKISNLKILPTLDEFEKVCRQLSKGSESKSSLSIRLGCIYDHGDGLKFCDSLGQAPKDANVVVGAVIKIPQPDGNSSQILSRFFPGEMVGDLFVPGQRISSANGEFIPAACIRSATDTFQFLPGIIFDCGTFVIGQFISDKNNDGNLVFTKGQAVPTSQGSKFVHGETISTLDGLKFVAGLPIDGVFVNGVLVDAGGETCQFIPGQLVGLADVDDQLRFVAGLMDVKKESFVPGLTVEGEFYPGQMVFTPDSGLTFLYGEVSVTKNNLGHFLPGMYFEDKFHPGLLSDTEKGWKFLEGKLAKLGQEAIFVPGKIIWRDERFEKVSDPSQFTILPSPATICQGINEAALSVVFKKSKAKTGVLLMTPDGPKFFLESEIPAEFISCEKIPGRLECSEDGPKFVAGKVMEINGIKTFIPGKMLKDSQGKEIFVPGKMINGKNGPKFVPGQVIQAENEEEKFIPGQVIDGTFVPGMVIHTKSGPLFIPGQVVRTDDGLKFVPGQIVENDFGALFVPGEVIDSPDRARFVPGQVVETPEGPRLLPPDIKGDGNLEYLVQGFDINQEEARLILGGCESLIAGDLTDFLGGIGDATIGGEALVALAEGFDDFNGNMIAMMRDEDVDIEKLVQDESLESCDTPAVRKTLHGVFLSVFSEMSQWIDDAFGKLDKYMSTRLNDRLWTSLLSSDADKLYPALESLKLYCSVRHPDDPPEFEIFNLIAGMVFCSLPGALKECSSMDDGKINEARLRAILSAGIEESVRGILEEDGIVPTGRKDNLRELIRLAKDLQFDDNESYFAKVVAVTEGRCGTKFMNDLMSKLRNGAEDFSLHQILQRMVNVLAPRSHLKTGFTELAACSPDFIEDLLESLKIEAGSDDLEKNSIDVLHRAITRAVNRRCQRQLDDVVHRVELDALFLEKDRDIRDMLEEAVGLARFIHNDDVTDTLNELLADPIRLEVIRDDPVVRDVLNKILVMRKLCANDANKKNKLDRLRRYNSDDEEDDTSLREMIRLCDALTKLPHQGQLRKSKSMIKKSKSMIVSAKDIPMNAFMAIKSTADQKDSNWLQNFLSESLVDDVPWECSKALIILKEGYQAIIPREAARSILLGDASYTLIDENGVEFYLSPKDKKNRQKQGLDDVPKKRVTLVENDERVKDNPAPKSTQNGTKNGNGLSKSYSFDDSEESHPSSSYRNGRESHPKVSNFLSDDFKFSDFDSNLDYKTTDLGYTSRAPRSRFLHDDLIESSALASLEKYRPCNYEIGPARGDGDDINDIRDYYSGLATRQRAMRRVYDFSNENQVDDFDPYDADGYQPMQERKPQRSSRFLRSRDQPQQQQQHPLYRQQDQYGQMYNDYDDDSYLRSSPGRQEFQQYGYGQPPNYVDNGFSQGQRQNGYYQQQSDPYGYPNPSYPRGPVFDVRQPQRVDLDDSTKSLLNRAKAARQNPYWDDEINQNKRMNNTLSKYNWDKDTFEDSQSFQSPNIQKQPEKRETALSSKTQKLLSQLKESTAALEAGINQNVPTRSLNPYLDSRQPERKPSRFYHKESSPVQQNPKNYGGYSVHDLADDILGENIRPNREPQRRSTISSRYDDDYNQPSFSQGSRFSVTSRKYSEPSYNTSFRKTPERSTNRFSPVRTKTSSSKKFVDQDEDLDSMINDLKKRTATRDMYKVVSEIEGRAITPVRRSDLSPSPSRENFRSQRRPPPPSQRYGDGDDEAPRFQARGRNFR